MNNLAAALSWQGNGVGRRIGTVSSTSPLTISVPTGDLYPTARMASYAPVAGDLVLMLVDDRGAAIVLGKMVSV